MFNNKMEKICVGTCHHGNARDSLFCCKKALAKNQGVAYKVKNLVLPKESSGLCHGLLGGNFQALQCHANRNAFVSLGAFEPHQCHDAGWVLWFMPNHLDLLRGWRLRSAMWIVSHASKMEPQ